MLLIYSPKPSPRLEYILQLFFGELIQTDYKVTNDQREFESYDAAKLNYSQVKFGDEVFLFAAGLLFENNIHEQTIPIIEWKKVKALFAHDQFSILPFDPFAAAFYLVSRYEEHLDFTPDEHARFPDQLSLNFKEGFHEVAVVNRYAIFLKEILQQQFPQLIFKTPSYQFQLTYDIDSAFAFREKGMLRNAGGAAKSLLKFETKEILSRIKVLSGKKPDPFDTFDFQFSLHKKFNLHPLYYFLLADYGALDKNISWKKNDFQALIKKISGNYETGIHSGYASNLHPEKVDEEKNRLEKIIGKNIVRNRQHFLKLRFPSTYKNLLANGITEDYTMGYASLAGFRAGIASPFLWYDLENEKTTTLKIFPFAVMDASLHYYLKLSPDEALTKSKQLIDEVKKVNGYFQFLAHNDLLSEAVWKGWRQKFEALIAYAS